MDGQIRKHNKKERKRACIRKCAKGGKLHYKSADTQ